MLECRRTLLRCKKDDYTNMRLDAGFRTEVRAYYCEYNGEKLPLGMGCAALGGPADTLALARFQATLDAAYECGIRYFDTSVNYGGSEFRLGQFLRRVPRDSLFVATKSGIPSAYTPCEAKVHLRQAIRNSQERLGLDVIDLFQIHDVDTLDQSLAPGGALEELVEAQATGAIRYIGLGTRFHDLLEEAINQGQFDTILTYSDFTPLNQTAGALITLASGRGVGVINGSPLAFGLMTGADPRSNPRIEGEYRRYVGLAGKLYDLCVEHGVSTLNVALRYPMCNSDIAITLTGPGSPDELQAALAAAATAIPNRFWQDLRQYLGIPLPA